MDEQQVRRLRGVDELVVVDDEQHVRPTRHLARSVWSLPRIDAHPNPCSYPDSSLQVASRNAAIVRSLTNDNFFSSSTTTIFWWMRSKLRPSAAASAL